MLNFHPVIQVLCVNVKLKYTTYSYPGLHFSKDSLGQYLNTLYEAITGKLSNQTAILQKVDVFPALPFELCHQSFIW